MDIDSTTIIAAFIGAISLIVAAIITTIGTITAAKISRSITEASKSATTREESTREEKASSRSLVALFVISIILAGYNFFQIVGYYFHGDALVTARAVLNITFSVFSFTIFLLLAAFSAGMLRVRRKLNGID